MPKVNDTMAQAIRTAIRRILINNPWASILEVQGSLHANGYKTYAGNPLNWVYVKKMVEKVLAERRTRADRYRLSEKLAEFEDSIRESNHRLLQIINEVKVNGLTGKAEAVHDVETVMKAMAQLRDNQATLLKAQMVAGVFDRRTPIDPAAAQGMTAGQMEAIERAGGNAGLLALPTEAKEVNG